MKKLSYERALLDYDTLVDETMEDYDEILELPKDADEQALLNPVTLEQEIRVYHPRLPDGIVELDFI